MKKNQYNNLINSNSDTTLFLWFLFALTIFLTLLPFLKIGVTNCDDLEFYLNGSRTSREIYAQSAGRFYFLITKPVYHIAYLIDNFYYTKAIQYGCVLLSFTLFGVVIKKIFKQTAFTLLVFLLLFVFLTVTPNYFIPIIALPVYFTVSFSIFLISLLFLIKYYETNKYKHLIFSVLFAAVALLFYENYLIFILFVMLFIFSRNISEQSVSKFLKTKKIYKELIPFIVICLVYVAIYYLYRWYVQTEKGFYCGTTIAKDFSFNNFLKFIWNPNNTALPTYVYFMQQSCIQQNSLLVAGHQNNFLYILVNSQPGSIVNTLIQCFLFCILFSKVKLDISWKKIGITVLFLFVFIFAVNFLLAITEKHNALYYKMNGYVTTYYSYFCITLFIAFLAYSCLKLGYRNKYIKTSVITVFTALIFYVSIIIGYSNDHLSRDWQLCHGKHIMMKQVLKEGIFDEMSNNDLIYVGGYDQSVSKLGQKVYLLQPGFWVYYIHTRVDKNLNVYHRFEMLKDKIQANSEQNVYILTKYETQKSRDILLVMSKVNIHSIDFENEKTAFSAATANEAVVYYYSENKNFIFQFIIPQSLPESTVKINNNKIQKVSSGVNSVRIENTKKKKILTTFTLQSDAPFLVKDFAISNIGFVNEEILQLQ